MTAKARLAAVGRGARTFATDVAEGFFEITHNSLALLGVAVVVIAALLATRPDLRAQGEERLTSWLTARKVAAMGIQPELGAIERATAANPTLILAVMAIESSFNPFAQSPVGAQGLMQVMTEIHSDKYQNFGGQYAAFDPKSNLRVGVKVLQECIARAGSVEAGLKWYVGAANLPTDGGYADKVLAEHGRLYQVAKGKPVPTTTPALRAEATPAPATVPSTPATKPVEAVKVASIS